MCMLLSVLFIKFLNNLCISNLVTVKKKNIYAMRTTTINKNTFE